MMRWLLLLSTVGCSYLTYDAFRWRTAVERGPFSIIAKMWKGELSHLSLAERAEVQRRVASSWSGMGEICWAFLAITLGLAVATVRAFHDAWNG